MAEEIKTVKKSGHKETIHIPKGYVNDEPNLVVSVNGKNYVLPKGKDSEVPDFVAKEIRRSWRAQEKYDAKSEELLKKAKAPV